MNFAKALTFHERAQTLHDEIAKSHPSLMRGRVWCARCNAFKDIDAAKCLKEGWPKCHGATMSIDKPKDDGCGNG